jgi:hypothetical protein
MTSTNQDEGKVAVAFSDNEGDDDQSLLIRISDMQKVPEEVQAPILNLIEVCKEKDVVIPFELGTSMLNILSSSRCARASVVMNYSERLAEEREEVKESINANPVVAQAIRIQQHLGIDRQPDLNLRTIKDGYFKFTERVD